MESALPTETFGHRWLSWAYDGVDPKIPGNGGEECMAVIPTGQKVVETVVLVLVGLIQIRHALQRVSVSDINHSNTCTDAIGRRILLMAMCLVFGAEIGFKLASRQLIWVLNQCHVITMLQVTHPFGYSKFRDKLFKNVHSTFLYIVLKCIFVHVQFTLGCQ
jgi:TMEM164 family